MKLNFVLWLENNPSIGDQIMSAFSNFGDGAREGAKK